jgi:hypothetical protein
MSRAAQAFHRLLRVVDLRAHPTRQHATVSLVLLDCQTKSALTLCFTPSASPLLMLRGRPAVAHDQGPSSRRSASTLIRCTLCRRSRMRARFDICTSGNVDAGAAHTAHGATLIANGTARGILKRSSGAYSVSLLLVPPLLSHPVTFRQAVIHQQYLLFRSHTCLRRRQRSRDLHPPLGHQHTGYFSPYTRRTEWPRGCARNRRPSRRR